MNGDPKNYQYRLDLARAYQLDGQVKNAVKELQESARINPGAQAQVDEYIKKVQTGINF